MVGRIYRPDYFPGGDVSVPMAQLSAVTVAYAQYYDPSGTLQPLLGGQTSATSPYAIQIGGVAQTSVHAYSVATRPFVNIARPVDGTGTGIGGDNDVFQGNATNEMVIWDERTTDAGAQPQLFGVNRYGLPGLSGGDAGVMSQTRAIDVFDMGGGNDLVSLIYNSGNFGGPGIAYTANATIYGGDGTDWVWSGAGNDVIFGGNDSDTLFGGNGADTIYGGAGVDTIQGGAGADILVGGGDGDWVSYANSSAGVRLTLPFDIDLDQSGGDAAGDRLSGFDNVIGSFFDDEISVNITNVVTNTLVGLGGNDTLRGGDGDDVLYGGAGGGIALANAQAGGIDTLFGNTGNDTLVYDTDGTVDGSGNDDFVLVYVGDGSGAVRPNNLTVTISGGHNYSRDYLEGNEGFDTILMGAGADILLRNTDDLTVNGVAVPTGQQANLIEFVEAGAGDDIVALNNASAGAAGTSYNLGVTVVGGAGNDFVATGDGADVLWGDLTNATGNGADTLFGGSGGDTVYGGDGDDLVEGGAGGDTLYGGAGNDTLSYSFSDAGVTVTLGGARSGGHAQSDVVANDFENLAGSAFNDVLAGDGNANRIFGNAGLDSLRGFAGNDTIFGGAGVDTIEGGVGSDSLYGGGEGDWLSYANAGGGVTVNLALATQTSASDANGDVIGGFQNLIGSANADTLTGDGAANTIYGGSGVDTIQGGGGGDSMTGGGNGDWLSYAASGGAVDVSLLAGAGSGGDAEGDVFSGFANLIGSANADTLGGDNAVNTIFGGAGADTVEGRGGGDSMVGGGEGDWLSYANSGAGVSVSLSSGSGTGGDAQDDAFSGFANLIGSANDDSLTGDDGDNTIVGGLGVDTIEGGGGNDFLYGGADSLAPTDGDWLMYLNAPGGVQVSLFAGTATGAAGTDILGGFQHLVGSLLGDDFLEGDDDNNTIIGRGGSDTLSGLGGIDTIYGGDGNDTVLAGTNGGTFDTTVVGGWDGDVGSDAVNVTLALGAERVSDLVFGGAGTDTLDMAQLIGDAPRTLFTSPNSNFPTFLSGIEIIIAGAAADVINLTFNDGVTRTAYAENVTIYAGGNADLVFSGSGADLIVGGQSVASTDAGDTLFGGQGNDLIYGDDFNIDNTTGGGDTLYGGGGLDTIIGGGGNDVIYDNDGGLLYGGHGDDVVVLIGGNGLDDYLASGGFVEIGGSINPNAATDGNDHVFVGGSYNSLQSDLGAGDDSFIASSSPLGSGFKTDVVTGGTGSDVISSWYGDDVLYGDYDPSDTSGNGGNDALWGGAGVDTIFGGPGTDYLYGGAGDGDLLVGGAGSDYYYWARTDGIDRIDDQGGESENFIVVFPGFDATDQMPAGSGVFETDHDLYDNAGGDDMVQITLDPDGDGSTEYILNVLQGPGAGSQLYFDSDEISVIALWNNDATGSTPVITTYVWDPMLGRYEYHA